jgi:uncharacterized membrane protein YGL010W
MLLLTAIFLQTNVAVPGHFIAQLLPDLPKTYYPYFNLGMLTAIGYGVFYARLDFLFGVPSLAALVFAGFKLTDYHTVHGTAANWHALYIHVASWIAQFIGHGAFEHRAPALLDSLVQALVLAPFFAVFEVFYLIGIRTGVIDRIDEMIKPELEAFHNKKKK